MKRNLLAALFALLLPSLPGAETLLETDRSWDGGVFHYPGGKPRITSIILALGEGEMTPWHCHPVPTMGYLVSGSLEVETVNGERIRLREGDSVVEAMGTLHRGHGLAGGVEIAVFYAGAEGLYDTVLADDPESAALCSGEPPDS